MSADEDGLVFVGEMAFHVEDEWTELVLRDVLEEDIARDDEDAFELAEGFVRSSGFVDFRVEHLEGVGDVPAGIRLQEHLEERVDHAIELRNAFHEPVLRCVANQRVIVVKEVQHYE